MTLPIRPTRVTKYPSLAPSVGYELPVVLCGSAGRSVRTFARAVPEVFVEPLVISEQLLDEVGGQTMNRVYWSIDNGKRSIYVPLTVAVERAHDPLVGCALARVEAGAKMATIGPALLHSLADVGTAADSLSLAYPKTEMCQWSFDRLALSAVLVVGKDQKEHLFRLRLIEVCVNERSSQRAWLLRDYHDVSGWNVLRKLAAMAAVSKFVIVDDVIPSGHLVELQLLSQMSLPIAVLRAAGVGTTWMLDPILSGNNIHVFDYAPDDEIAFYRAAAQACRWADELLSKRSDELDSRYPWRKDEIAMADALPGLDRNVRKNHSGSSRRRRRGVRGSKS